MVGLFAALKTDMLTLATRGSRSEGGTISRDVATHLPLGSMCGVVYVGSHPAWLSKIPHVFRPVSFPIAAMVGDESVAVDFAVTFDRLCVSRDVNLTESFFEDTIKLSADGVDFVPENPAANDYIRAAMVGMTISMKPIYRRCAYAHHTSADESQILKLLAGGFPALLISGSNDAFFDSNKLVESLKRDAKDLKVHIVHGASHATFIDSPEEVMNAIFYFAKRVHSM